VSGCGAGQAESLLAHLHLVAFPGVVVHHDPPAAFAEEEVRVVRGVMLLAGVDDALRVRAENVEPEVRVDRLLGAAADLAAGFLFALGLAFELRCLGDGAGVQDFDVRQTPHTNCPFVDGFTVFR